MIGNPSPDIAAAIPYPDVPPTVTTDDIEEHGVVAAVGLLQRTYLVSPAVVSLYAKPIAEPSNTIPVLLPNVLDVSTTL